MVRELRELSPDRAPVELPVGGRRALVGLSREALEAFVETLGEPRYRARQLFRWLYGRAARSFAEMTDLPRDLRSRLEAVAHPGCLVEERRQHSPATRTTKFLFRLLADGNVVESVLMRHDYGWSVCLSSQVGCRMGCTFCASTLGGLVRNLTAGEIVDQLLVMSREVPAGERIGHVVLMGSGEPLENYDNVLKAIRLLHDPDGPGIGYRHITISTAGLVPAMRRLAGEGLPVTLAVSLHAPDDELRARLMPITRIYPLAEVLAAAREYAAGTGRRVTYEYLLIEGVNDGEEHAGRLAGLLRGSLAHVNLIPFNPVTERPQYRRPGRARVARFARALEARGIATTVRREMGGEIDAACGQLRNRARQPAARLGQTPGGPGAPAPA
ncbi:23S rRNA (adenine(2503)-C(2))-methyltransferase RlmN [Caldinitratiruptor microaerophilus]|uniref:Probable dual-specificity RNA methyltransferase RlmN n=1 Tax=Caldinitratiruptor microaerophilus TaxID=671077 RepID=A0AA35CLD0_9FIRM|nr:23S rRNA (adenine(2503)-C(2))-methyltransferase RlmN [Caldinitratiruptor microaerophilus]BDG60654.1 putative dual-specificity RNA methyltransferase RlmN [Caldinitratiruptor microaerophilus]